MSRPGLALVLIAILSPGLPAAPPQARQAEVADDEAALVRAGVGVGGEALLDFFRARTVPAATRARIRELVRRLGDAHFAAREKAAAELIALGAVAQGPLREALRDPDAEVVRRAGACLAVVEKAGEAALASAAARLLAVRKPRGAAPVLLAYLADAPDEDVAEDVVVTLTALARSDGASEAAVAAALTDAAPARRAGAAEALTRAAAAARRPAVRRLLADPDPAVRLRTALALARARDGAAIPVLIGLLAELPAEQGARAEDLLCRLAGAGAPAATLGTSAESRRRCRDAWQAWWRQHGAAADLARLADAGPPLGYTLLVLMEAGAVVEWGRDGKPRWRIDQLDSPLDAQVLPGGRVLVAEPRRGVTERDLRGKVLRQWKFADPPMHADRLANGNTLVVTQKAIWEVGPAGKQVERYRAASPGIVTARRFADGRIGCILTAGTFVLLDARGKELRRFPVGPACTTNSLTPLANGHILVVAYGTGVVCEHDAAGKVVWTARASRPLCAARLPGGRTLVSTQDMVLVEYDHGGREVGRRPAPGHPAQVRLR
jgi:hypothetical protein